MVNARFGCLAFHRDTQPYILWDEAGAEVLGHTLSPFGKDLVAVLGRAADGLHNAVDKLERYLFVEDVAHGADKDVMGFLPLQRLVEVVFVQR